MPGVETVLYLDDQLHESKSGPTLAASSTANGYAIGAVRRPDWKTAWKPSDSAADEDLVVTGPSQTWLGSTGGDDIYSAVMYDARGADQNVIFIQQETIEGSGVWNAASPRLTITVNKTGPAIALGFWNLATGGRTKYRLVQLNADRGGGTKTVRIFGWAVFAVGDYHAVGTDDANATGIGALRAIAHTGRFRSLTLQESTNRNAQPSQGFDLTFQPGAKALWELLRDQFFVFGGIGRPFFIQYQGLRNPGQDNVGLVRLDGRGYEAHRQVRDELEMSVPLLTEVFV